MFQPFLVKNFYSSDLVELAQAQIDLLKRNGSGDRDDKDFNRISYHNHPFFVALHKLQTKKIEKLLERKLKPSYCFASMYFEGLGKCDKHTDRPPCKYTVDVCINQKEPWSFYAYAGGENLKFDMEPGDAIVLSGTDHPHWREPIQVGNFCDLVFFHYVDEDYTGELN